MDKATFAPQGGAHVQVRTGIPRLGGMSLRTGQGDTMQTAAQPQVVVAQPGGGAQVPRGAQMVTLAGQGVAQPQPTPQPQAPARRPAMGDREVRLITVHAVSLDGGEQVAEYEVDLARGSRITGVSERLVE
jgi:hypothetical protein